MAADYKYYETGSIPYYLNINNTAKDFSFNESTNPPYGLLDNLSKFLIIEDNYKIQPPIIQQDLILDRPDKK